MSTIAVPEGVAARSRWEFRPLRALALFGLFILAVLVLLALVYVIPTRPAKLDGVWIGDTADYSMRLASGRTWTTDYESGERDSSTYVLSAKNRVLFDSHSTYPGYEDPVLMYRFSWGNRMMTLYYADYPDDGVASIWYLAGSPEAWVNEHIFN